MKCWALLWILWAEQERELINMNVCQISTPAAAAVATVAKEVVAANEMQMAILKSISDSQQQMAEMLQAAGIGQNLDVQA